MCIIKPSFHVVSLEWKNNGLICRVARMVEVCCGGGGGCDVVENLLVECRFKGHELAYWKI